jgi:hypothetical protein
MRCRVRVDVTEQCRRFVLLVRRAAGGDGEDGVRSKVLPVAPQEAGGRSVIAQALPAQAEGRTKRPAMTLPRERA